MAGRDEQETNVTQGRLDDYVEIWTNNVVDVRKLEKEPRAKRVSPVYPNDVAYTADELAAHIEEGWGVTYHASTSDFTALGGFKRRVKEQTPEQKAAAGARLRAARQSGTVETTNEGEQE